MIHYNILGCDDNALSMIFEILASIQDGKVSVNIVRNMELPGKRFEYAVSGIEHEEIAAEEWRKGNHGCILGVVTPSAKKTVQGYFEEKFGIMIHDYISISHIDTSVAKTGTVGNGVVINPGVVVAPYSEVADFVSINRGVTVGHHTKIGSYTTINPGANIAGHCNIGSSVTIGMGANILDHISIGDNSVIGAGSLVNKDIPPNVIAFGAPARVIKHR